MRLVETGQCVSRVDTVASLSELANCSEASRNGSVCHVCLVSQVDTCCFLVTSGRTNSSEASRHVSVFHVCLVSQIDTCCFLITTGRVSSRASKNRSVCVSRVLCHR